jgi:hypothetical protein
VPFAYLAESQDILGWIEAPAKALNYPFETLIGAISLVSEPVTM